MAGGEDVSCVLPCTLPPVLFPLLYVVHHNSNHKPPSGINRLRSTHHLCLCLRMARGKGKKKAGKHEVTEVTEEETGQLAEGEGTREVKKPAGKGGKKAGKAKAVEVLEVAEAETTELTRGEQAMEEDAELREIMGIGGANISMVSSDWPFPLAAI